MTASLPGTGLSYVSTRTTVPSVSSVRPKTRPLFWLLLVMAVAGTAYALTL
jgi:hypothetical protein